MFEASCVPARSAWMEPRSLGGTVAGAAPAADSGTMRDRATATTQRPALIATTSSSSQRKLDFGRKYRPLCGVHAVTIVRMGLSVAILEPGSKSIPDQPIPFGRRVAPALETHDYNGPGDWSLDSIRR